MLKQSVRRMAVALILAAALGVSVAGFFANGPSWADGNIVMHLQLGSSGPLIDGCQSWGCSAESALSIWNNFLQRSKFTVVRDSGVSKDKCDPSALPCNTNVFFSDTMYGDPFGGSTLAVTLSRWFVSSNRLFETDVIFNTAFSWNSYRGGRRSGITDFRRVAIHEFGHALGLAHPDQHGQNVSSIMNAVISDIDNLTQDDINGAMAIYGGGGGGPVINFPPRDQIHRFRTSLEPVYRDELRRQPVFSFTDVEGAVVWVQEYIRYRLNGCDHNQALERTRIQILGGGVQPVCGPASTGPIMFPDRRDPVAFRAFLEQLYRDVLRRFAVLTYVDQEGDVVWIQEYLLMRLQGCDDATATQKVLIQLRGGGVQPGCNQGPPPPPPPGPPPPGPPTNPMTGTWKGNNSIIGSFTMLLTQTGSKIAGTYSDSFGPGQIDPAEPGTIDGAGNVTMRVKQAHFTDFTFKGKLDATGRHVTGGIHGSGFKGEPFTLDKQ